MQEQQPTCQAQAAEDAKTVPQAAAVPQQVKKNQKNGKLFLKGVMLCREEMEKDHRAQAREQADAEDPAQQTRHQRAEQKTCAAQDGAMRPMVAVEAGPSAAAAVR